MNRKIRANFLLLLTSFIWGSAFVAQSVGMEHIGPFTFNVARMLVSGIALTPIVLFLDRNAKSGTENPDVIQHAQDVSGKSNKTVYLGGLCCGLALFCASSFQQVGLLYTTAGKAGFITTLYIIIVPLLGLFMGKKAGKKIWFCVLLALIGIYLLCMIENLRMNRGDFLMLFSALGYAMHIIVVDHFSPKTNALRLSHIQFFVCAFFSFVLMLVFESPELRNILISWFPILYAGLLSGAVGFTLQIIAQKDTTPTVTALILSFEAVFAVLTGFVILNEILSVHEIFGCALMFAAIIIAQLPEKTEKNKLEDISK